MKANASLAKAALLCLGAAVTLSSCADTANQDTTATSNTTVVDSAAMAPLPADNAANMQMTDQDFVTQASAANVAEVNAHQAALKNATTADVKAHAKHMLTDHEQLGKDMKALADKKNMTVSTTPPPDKAKMLEDMNATKKGKDWDMAYLDAQVNDHNEAIALFERGQASVQDPELKALIDSALPKLRDHLKMVQDARAKMGGGGAAM